MSADVGSRAPDFTSWVCDRSLPPIERAWGRLTLDREALTMAGPRLLARPPHLVVDS